MSLSLVFLICGLGAVGAVLRYVVAELFARRSRGFVGILMVNLFGSALAGGLAHNPTSALVVAVLIGLCGSLTTFSTVAVSVVPQPRSLSMPKTAGLLVGHALGSVIAAWSGFNLVALVS